MQHVPFCNAFEVFFGWHVKRDGNCGQVPRKGVLNVYRIEKIDPHRKGMDVQVKFLTKAVGTFSILSEFRLSLIHQGFKRMHGLC